MWNYGDFKNVGVKLFPATQSFTFTTTATAKKQTATISLELDDIATKSNWDEKTVVSGKYKKVETNDVLRNPFDYTWIMVAINDGVVPDLTAFSSPKKFLDYLSLVGVKNVPCRSTISAWNCKVVGKFPDWVFTDTDGRTEKLRRINVVRQFLSALKSIK